MKSLSLGGLALLLSICLPAPSVTAQDEAATANARWEALAARPFPQWFRDAKLGIFIHWGVYSVPGWSEPEQYAEWFLRGIQLGEEPRTEFMRRVYGEDFEYRDFAELFRAELFDPEAWAELFHAAGARYVVLTAKHHDGFALWPSRHASVSHGQPWNAVEVGPKRDLVGELSEAVRAAGLSMGLYYSLPEWNNPLYRWSDQDADGDVDRYVREHMLPQFRELMARYRPSVVFADGDWDHPASTWRSLEMLEWLFDESGCPADLVVNNRWGAGCKVGFRTPEYSAGAPPGDRPWAECRGLGRSFGLNRAETLDAYLSAAELIRFFACAVSHGGGMLLNVGPEADGRIPLLQQERLRQLGAWLQVNGEAIYGSTTAERLGEWQEVSVERVDAQLDFDWVRNSPADRIEPDRFTAQWNGFLEAPDDGSYRFRLDADDQAALWIGDRQVASGAEPGELSLKAGERLSIRVSFEEQTHDARLRLLWQRGEDEEAVVPASALFQQAVGAEAGLRASYGSQRQTIAYTAKPGRLYAITFDWPDDELRLECAEPADDSEVHLLGLERALPWSWDAGTLRVDTSSVRIGELPCEHAWIFRLSMP